MSAATLRAELARLHPDLAPALDAFADEVLLERLEVLAQTDDEIADLLDRHAEPDDDDVADTPEPVVVTLGLGEPVTPEVVLTRTAGLEVRFLADDGTPVVFRSLAASLLALAFRNAAREVNSKAHRAKLR